MKRGAVWLILGGIALLAAAIGYRTSGTGTGSDGPRASIAVKSTIMDLVLVDTKGQTQRMDQWRGKVLVANYWATWCFPCREEMPGFARLQDKYKDKGVQFVGISIDDANKIIEFQKQTPVNYPLLIGDMSTMAKSAELGNDRQALPFTAIFDRQGTFVTSKLGRWNEADLEPKLADLISR